MTSSSPVCWPLEPFSSLVLRSIISPHVFRAAGRFARASLLLLVVRRETPRKASGGVEEDDTARYGPLVPYSCRVAGGY